MSGKWMPIESAPRDGAVILVTDGTNYALRRWDTDPRWNPSWTFVTAGDLAWHSGFDGLETPDMSPTHWMLLPAPPAALKTGEGQ